MFIKLIAALSCTGTCLSHIYVMAFTSGVGDAGSDGGHAVELYTTSGTRSVRLYDRYGDDYLSHKGDLWKIPISDFHFSDGCITVPEISGIAMTERSTDGWHIESIVTFMKSGSDYQLLSEDFEANRWIDQDSGASNRRFDLTLVTP